MNPYAPSLIDEVDALLPAGHSEESGGSLLIMVGLPGSGKSYLVRHLLNLVAGTVISTDQVRHLVRQSPTYTAAEMVYIYEICFTIIDRRLQRRQRVIFDGSNYLSERRHRLREIAVRRQVPFALVNVQASVDETRIRLNRRSHTALKDEDLSDAGWSVYRWMVEAQEPIAGPHLILDTTDSPVEDLAAKLFQYWMDCERLNAPADDNL